MTKLIGVAGTIGSGKNTACEYLIDMLVDSGVSTLDKVAHAKFAHPLQDFIANLGGFYQDDLSHRMKFEDRAWKESEEISIEFQGERRVFTIRRAMQFFGDLFRQPQPRGFGKYFWTNQLLESVQGMDFALISDPRYPEDYLLSARGKPIDFLIWINCPRLEAVYRGTAPSESHYEFMESKADFVIYNDPELNPLDNFLHDLGAAFSKIISA